MSETASNSDKLMTHSYDGPKITELKGQPVRPPTPRPPPPAPRRARWPWFRDVGARVASYPELEGLPGAARGPDRTGIPLREPVAPALLLLPCSPAAPWGLGGRRSRREGGGLGRSSRPAGPTTLCRRSRSTHGH